MPAEESEQLEPAMLTLWYGEYAARIRVFLLGLLRNATLVDEAVQSTFAKALVTGGGVQAGSEKAWLFQVAFNEAMLLKRKSAIEQRALSRLPAIDKEPRQPIDHLLQWEAVHQVRLALEKLPDNQKQIVRRRIEKELTFQQIADELQIPLGTVLTRMRSALETLRSALLKLEHNDENDKT